MWKHRDKWQNYQQCPLSRISQKRDNNLYKSCILVCTRFDSPPNLVRVKGIYSTWARSILTSVPAWDLRVQLMEHEVEDH